MQTAIMGQPPSTAGDGLTAGNFGNLDQHCHAVLESLDVNIVMLDHEPGYPDSCFINGVAVVVPELGVIARPGTESRRGEKDLIESTRINQRVTEPEDRLMSGLASLSCHL